jgi:hypothetical protein
MVALKQRLDYITTGKVEKVIRRRVKLKVSGASRQTIRVLGEGFRARCVTCGREVEMVTAAQAAAVLRVDGQTLDSLVRAGQVHVIQTVSGNIWVCEDSLFSD